MNFHLPSFLALPLSLFFDIVGAAGIAGLILAAFRRYIRKPETLTYDTSPGNFIALLVLFGIFVCGFLVEGLRIAITQPSWATSSSGTGSDREAQK